LTSSSAPFDFYDQRRPIYTHARFLPGSSVRSSDLEDVLLAEGCKIDKASIKHSVVGLRCHISEGSEICDSVLMGADYYEHPGRELPGGITLGIGPDCSIEGAIVDKNARLGAGVTIRPFPPGTDLDEGNWFVRDGIVVIPKDSIIRPRTMITPESQSRSGQGKLDT
jgi:glucose-1-phosphate adenylyltransferase